MQKQIFVLDFFGCFFRSLYICGAERAQVICRNLRGIGHQAPGPTLDPLLSSYVRFHDPQVTEGVAASWLCLKSKHLFRDVGLRRAIAHRLPLTAEAYLLYEGGDTVPAPVMERLQKLGARQYASSPAPSCWARTPSWHLLRPEKTWQPRWRRRMAGTQNPRT